MEWDSRASAMTIDKKLINVTASVDENSSDFSFTKEKLD